MFLTEIAAATGSLFVLFSGITAVRLRRVVPTNMVHIVQTTKSSTPYGRGKEAGNTYYAFPTWVPKFGITVTEFPESIFQVTLDKYLAYDQARLPFVVTAVAFFRIETPELAAQRVATFNALREDLHVVLQGAVRRVLATNVLEHIMSARSELSAAFTEEVQEQVSQWGVTTVKAIEFMDIQDAEGSKVIENMMSKEVSRINKDSRVAVASNKQAAELAEIEAQQIVAIRQQESQQQIGTREAEKNRLIGIAEQTSQQQIVAAKKDTAEREMEVQKVQEVRGAEIRAEVATVEANQAKSVAIVQAEQNRETATVNAEAEAAAQVKLAEGALSAAQKDAEAIRARGEANAAAEQAMLMAPINAQIKLAEKIGSDKGYQEYLVTIRQVEAGQAVGLEMAKAMQGADLKVIASAGDPQSGVAKLGDLFTTQGGMGLTGMLSALATTTEGDALIKRLTGGAATAAGAETVE